MEGRRSEASSNGDHSVPQGLAARLLESHFPYLETNLDLASLTDHYMAQLEVAGWTRSDEGLDGPQAWSTWPFSNNEDHPWRAVFTALHIPDTSGRYLLHLCSD